MLLLIALCLAVGVGLKWYWDYRELHPSTDDAYVKAHIVDIAARVSGPVVAVHVAENDYVKAGAPLFAIGPATFDAAVASAAANYELATQATGANDAEVGVALSTLAERQVTLARAKRHLERATSLSKSNLIAESEFDNAIANQAEAAAAVERARADVRRARSKLGAKGDRNAAQRAAAATLTAAQLEQSFTRVVAPAAGLYNVMRTIGGSVGIAITSTLLVRREQVHWQQLGVHVRETNPRFQNWLDQADVGLDEPNAPLQLAQELFRHVQMNAFNDVFWFVSMIFLCLAPLVILLRNSRTMAKA